MANTQDLLSFESIFLLRFQEYLKTKVPELNYINQDLGQLEYYTMDRPAVAWPCALLDMSDTNYADQLNNVQEGTAVIVVRIGFNPFSATSNLQPEEVRKKGLFYYELEQKVYQALQGWDADGLCQPLTRIRKTTEKREEDAFRVRVLVFTTMFEDDGAQKESYKLTLPLDIEAELTPPN
jgi:hypothetical protein